MKKYLKKANNLIVDGTCSVLGAVHFATQTSADVVMSLESKIRRKNTGEDLESIKRDRMISTIKRQRWILDRVEAAQERISRRNAHKTISSFVDKTTGDLVPSEHYQITPSLTVK